MLPHPLHRMVGPFIFFDHLGPVTLPQGVTRAADVRPHPHIGLATVTYLFEGEIMHRDSTGVEQPIRPHEVNWMTAGSGITHSERFERARREGGPMHGIQAWVALPERDEETQPAFFHHGAADLPSFDERGVSWRLIAGEAFGAKAKVRTHSPMFYLHWEMARDAAAAVPADYAERAVYVAAGALEVDGAAVRSGEMAVLVPRTTALIRATEPAVVMALGGEPLGERFIEWNFVSSSKERIEQAKADWRAGRMKLPDLDNQEFIALPGDPQAAPNPMS